MKLDVLGDMVRSALFALLLLAGCPGARTTPPAEPAVPPEPMGTSPDSDEDGVADELDRCPTVPGSDDGCPSAKSGDDRDGDGVGNAVDRCPDDPEDFDAFQDDDGCPDPDNDNDGVSDAKDQCPNDAEDHDGFEDKDGCPDLDNDHDNVLDAQDKCPNEAETYNGYQDDDGCPDVFGGGSRFFDPKPSSSPPPPPPPKAKPRPKKPADRDGDGIPDDKDRCPDDPETINGRADGDGCPD